MIVEIYDTQENKKGNKDVLGFGNKKENQLQ